LIITIVLFVALLIDFFALEPSHKSFERSARYEIYVGFLIIILGIITSVLQLIPPPDSGIALGWHFSFDIVRFEHKPLRLLTAAYLPIPPFDLHFWNNYVWTASPYLKTLALLSVCSFVAFSMIGFVRKPFVFFLFAGCTFGLLAFFYFKNYDGWGSRHAGFLFIAFIMSAWLDRCREQTSWSISSESFFKKWETPFSHSITVVLLLQIVASFVAASVDYRHPFSMAKSVAEYISERGLNNRVIVGYSDWATSAIVGYLGISQFYYPDGDRFGSYVRWDKRRMTNWDEKPIEVMMKIIYQNVVDKARQLDAHELTDGKGQGVLIIVANPPFGDDLMQASKLQKIGEFTGAIRDDENFYIYSFDHSMK
jgi:hypothetical protein